MTDKSEGDVGGLTFRNESNLKTPAVRETEGIRGESNYRGIRGVLTGMPIKLEAGVDLAVPPNQKYGWCFRVRGDNQELIRMDWNCEVRIYQ